MTWASIEQLFTAALETPPEKLGALLDSHPDPAVSAEVRRLLARHLELSSKEGTAGFLDGIDRTRAAHLIDPAEAVIEPKSIGRYEIVRRLGRGATGLVYLAHDPTLGRDVALKLLSPSLSSDPSAVRRFSEEARAASSLDNPNIVTIHEIARTDDDRLFITMAYHPGETLRERISRGPLPLEDSLRIGIEIAEGLAAAHSSGIVHRDIKPENILLTARGACILDFGIAKIGEQTLTKTGAALGTAAYMSPEQTRGAGVDHRSDIWSLGVVMYEMLSGKRPFRAEGGEALVYQVRHDRPESLTSHGNGASAGLATTIMRCLEKDPAIRPQSAAGLALELRSPGSHHPRRVFRITRRAGIAAAAIVAVLIIVMASLNSDLPFANGRTQPAKHKPDMTAYDLYLRGTQNWNQRTRDRLETAIALFEKSIARDPQFALPYAGMANAYINMSNYGYMASDQALPKAMKAASNAIELDPSLAEAHASLGFLFASTGSFEKSETAFKRSLELNPNAASSHHFYSLLMMIEGRVDEALEANTRALAIDPVFPIANTNRGIILAQRKEFDAARSALKRSLELSQRNPFAHYYLGAMEAAEGNWRDALPFLQEASREAPTLPGLPAALAYTLRQLQRVPEADSVIRVLKSAGSDNRSRINIAFNEAVTGNIDSALSIMSRTQLDVPALLALRGEPLLDDLRATAGYSRLLARLGLKN